MMPPIKIARIINPITAKIDLKISGINFESNITIPMIHKTTIKGIIKIPPFIFFIILCFNYNVNI